MRSDPSSRLRSRAKVLIRNANGKMLSIWRLSPVIATVYKARGSIGFISVIYMLTKLEIVKGDSNSSSP